MVGVQDEQECPKCKGMGFYEFQTRGETEWFSCRKCGYHYDSYWENGEMKNEECGGFGAWNYMPTDRSLGDDGKRIKVGQSGSNPESPEEQSKLKAWLQDLKTKYKCRVEMTKKRGDKFTKVRFK